MKLRRSLTAGVLDAGLASLATLGTGLYAARALPISDLGTYALFFSAFVLAAVVPAQLTLSPASFVVVAAIGNPSDRLTLFSQTWRLAGPIAVAAALVASAAAWVAARAAVDVLVPLALTSAACAVLSPLQDHVRRVLHLGGASSSAALVSCVQVSCAGGALAAFDAVVVPPVWRPLGALALANAVSMAVGKWLVQRRVTSGAIAPLVVGSLMRRGRWLLATEAAFAGAVFLSGAMVTHFASPEALGRAEAARLVAQPVLVFSTGLFAVLWPHCVRAGAAGDRDEARRIARPYSGLLAVAAVIYAVLTAGRWWGNPLAFLVPAAYTVSGLVPLSVMAYALLALPLASRAQLFGATREQAVSIAALWGGAAQCGIALGSALVGPFTRPLGVGLFGAISAWLCARCCRALYLERAVTAPRNAGSDSDRA